MDVQTMSLRQYLANLMRPEIKERIGQTLGPMPYSVSPDRKHLRYELTAYGKAVRDVLGESAALSALFECEIYRTGPKIIRLGQLNCEALENTAISIAWEDYQQPFPVMIVELPKHYIQNRVAACPQHQEEFRGIELPAEHYPIFVKILFDSKHLLLITSVVFSSAQSIDKLAFAKTSIPTIDDIFTMQERKTFDGSAATTEVEEDYADRALRVALNACLMVMQGGFESSPDNPGQLANLERKLNVARKRKRAERAKMMRDAINAHPVVWEIADQNIRLWESSDKAETSDEPGSGSVKRPHWRRGHWRRQPYGIGREQRKLLFIKPMLINRGSVIGSVSASTATYTLPRKPR